MEKAGLTLVWAYRPTPKELLALAIDASSQNRFDGDDVEYALEKADWERQAATDDQPAGCSGDNPEA